MRSAQLNTCSTHIHTDTPTAHAHGPHRLCTPAVIAARSHTAAASTHTRDGRSKVLFTQQRTQRAPEAHSYLTAVAAPAVSRVR